MLDKKLQMWYNGKIGSQRPLASRKNEPPCCATRGYVDLVCQTVALSGANLRTLPMVCRVPFTPPTKALGQSAYIWHLHRHKLGWELWGSHPFPQLAVVLKAFP